MKTIILYKTLIRLILLYAFLGLLMCDSILSQSSESSNADDHVLKTELRIEEGVHYLDKEMKTNDQAGSNVTKGSVNESTKNKLIVIKVQKKVDEVGKNDGLSSAVWSAEEDQIEVTVAPGDRSTQTLTIQNSGDSPLIWNVSPEGNEKLLYRLYVKDRDLLEVMNTGKTKSDEVLTSDIFDAKITALKMMKSKIHNINSEVSPIKENLHKQKEQTKTDDFVKSFNDVSSSELSNQIELTKQQKVGKTKTTKEHSDFKIDKIDHHKSDYSDVVKISNHKKIFQEKVNGFDLEDQLQVFQQWYRFADCGYSTFDPPTEVWEVSRDNGVHWQQILSINGERYVVNARCFNPADYLEHNIMKDRKSPYSKLTSLQEFVKQVERGPSLYPKSGIIPAKTSEEIEIEVDASLLEGGTYSPHLVITDAGSMKTVSVVPMHLKVISELESVPPINLQKQTLAEELPDEFELSQNYPNPFNPSTLIKYSVPESGFIKLFVYNLIGEEVSVLVNETLNAGYYEVAFNAANLPSGIYFYRLQAGSFVKTKKMMLLK